MSESRDICVLFADVSGSTKLYETLGDAAALAAVERCIEAMKRATLLNKGRVVKTIGDEVMAVFDSAALGFQAASEMQLRIDGLPPPAQNVKLAIRAGFHFGPAIVENNDVFGDTVNTAARMAGLAKAGQIITTADTVSTLPEMLCTSCREIAALNVKGKADSIRVCEVIWQESEELTMMATRMVSAAPVKIRLVLHHGNDKFVLDDDHPNAALGRDPGSTIVIADPRASRSHAKIEYRRDKFVLVDMSSNGTYITYAGESELALKREEVILRGSGRIVFGHPWSGEIPTETVEFLIEL